MKTATSIPVIWLVLVALSDPVAAQVDSSRRPAVDETRPAFEVTEARKSQDLLPVTKGMRPPRKVHLALVAPKVSTHKASKEDEPSPKPNDIIIDVAVAYTKKAARNYGDIEYELVDLAIEEANKSFSLSNLGHIRLRLVRAYQTNYVEEGSHFDQVWRFADRGDGYMDEVHGLRDFHRADIAVLIVDDSKGCGLTTRVGADAHSPSCIMPAPRKLHARTRDRTSHLREPRTQLRQRDQVAGHNEHQGKLRRVPAHCCLVKPDSTNQRRSCRHC